LGSTFYPDTAYTYIYQWFDLQYKLFKKLQYYPEQLEAVYLMMSYKKLIIFN